ncbi:MAG: hypothetical protein M0R32_09075 [Candidatus Cloacimonetes bacterium]|jgi:UDP-2,3-diacylglucosamine pyrophosphatase LpxH|nr:hypothetical protein [Candidatus Cloacimonadota bacterium]
MSFQNQLVSFEEIKGNDPYGNRTFSCKFKPEASEGGRILGIFKRKEVEIKIRLLTLKEIFSRFISQNKTFAPIFEDLLSSDKRKVFFYQPNINYKKEHFVLVFSSGQDDMKRFEDDTISIAMNKHFWKVAQSYDIAVFLDYKDGHKIYINGKEYKYSLLQKYIKEYWNLYDALETCLSSRDSFVKLDNTNSLASIMFSDLHLADKTRIDNFGEIKERRLIEMINRFALDTTVIIPGDFLDLWQTTYKNIEMAYSGKGSLFEAISRIKRLILICGNHDEDIVDKRDINEWVRGQIPNATILPYAIISSDGFDAITYHGDKQDPSNNHTVFGRTVSKFAALLEKSATYLIDPKTGRSSVEQKLMGFLKRYLAPTKTLIDSCVIRNLTSFITDINIYLYWNRTKLSGLSEDRNQKLIIVIGHTHDLIRHYDEKVIQQSISLLIEEFVKETEESKKTNPSFLINKLDVKYINTGTGSGETLYAEKTMNRHRWKSVKREMEQLEKGCMGYFEYKKRHGEPDDPGYGRQDSIWIYDNGDKVLLSYTEGDYCQPSDPVGYDSIID